MRKAATSVRFWRQLAVALRHLSPESIQQDADRPFSLALVGAEAELQYWTEKLVPAELGERKRDQGLKRLFPIPVPISPTYTQLMPRFDLCLVPATSAAEVRPFIRDYLLLEDVADDRWAELLLEDVQERRPDWSLALARCYWPLRQPVVDRIIRAVARENAGFAILSALPNLLPSPLQLPWIFGEFASDTAFLTANQFRMAFLVAAASDAPVGWRQQKAQLASIAGTAFGWRALARELAGKVPAGGGLVAKGLVAYSATYVVGRGLEHFHRLGQRFTRTEKQKAYQDAWRSGRKVVEDVARHFAHRGARPALP